jgi:hypothetical protein
VAVRDEGQSFRSASNFLWNPKFDHFVSGKNDKPDMD